MYNGLVFWPTLYLQQSQSPDVAEEDDDFACTTVRRISFISAFRAGEG